MNDILKIALPIIQAPMAGGATYMSCHENEILDYPIQNALTTPMRKEAAKQNNIDYMSMWAGQRSHLCKQQPAAELICELQSAFFNA